MEPWKQRLYSGYVSTGQAAGLSVEVSALVPARYPHLLGLLRQVLPARRDVRILDLACGHGPLLMCARALGYQQVHGVDVSAEQVDLAHRLGLHDVVRQDLFEYLQGRRAAFDVVFAMDVLEHLTRDELLECLDRLHAALAPGGLLVLHVPNAEGLFGMRVRYGDLTHETAFTASSARQMLSAAGFTDIRCHEEKPHVKGIVSAVRRVIWNVMTAPVRLLMAAESGQFGQILSQNMVVKAVSRAGPASLKSE